MSLVRARAILLRSHPYSESSRVLRFLTDAGGVVGVMARGVRRPSSGGSGLDIFAEGDLTYHMRETRELQTYKEFSVTHARRGLGADPARLAAAAVLAEFVLRHAEQGEAGALFECVSGALDRLERAESADVVGHLLAEGWRLIATLGFHPDLSHCARCGEPVGDEGIARLDLAQGAIMCDRCMPEHVAAGVGPRLGPRARGQLRTLLTGNVPHDLERPGAHLQLLSDFATYHLGGTRPLGAFRVLAALLPPTAADA